MHGDADQFPPLLDPDAPELRTVFGLDPVQLHARFWASYGVQVVRVGEPGELVRGAELFLLLDPRSLPIFSLAPVMEELDWLEPAVLTLRLRDARERGYREMAVTGEDDRFICFRRLYSEHDERLARAALTPDLEIAKLWQQAGDPLNGWYRIRRFVPRAERAARSIEATVYDRTDDAEVAMLLDRLVGGWKRPEAAIPRARRLPVDPRHPGRSEVWADVDSDAGAANLVGRVWVGAGRQLSADQTVVGPAIVWDDPSHRPTGVDLTRVSWADLRMGATRGGDKPAGAAVEPDAEEVRGQREQRRAMRLSRRSEIAKRAFDIGFSLMALALTAPLWPPILLAIYLTDGRPFFFGHTRQSRDGKPFACWKFRSMYNNAEEMKKQLIAEGKNEADGAQFYMENDPRITTIGKILRKTNLDELPQFYNVLRGEMSVVGPRPSPDKENQFNPAWREARLSVRPGITGLWQIRRTRAEGADFQEWIRYDIEYVETRSFWGDIGLIFKTVAMILRKVTRG